MRGWLREYAETVRRYDGTSGSSSHQTPSTGPVPMDVDWTRAVSGFSSRAKVRARQVTRVRIRRRCPNLSNSKGTAGIATNRDTSADCRKRIAHAKSKGGVAAASADDGDVTAVMEVDNVTGDDETCFALASTCAVVGSTGSLPGQRSDEHLSTPKFADLIPTGRDRSPLKLKDVQRGDLVTPGQKTMVGPTDGKHAMEATDPSC